MPVKKTRSASKKPSASSKKPKLKSPKALKAELWELCKQIVRKRYIQKDGTYECYTCSRRIDTPSKAHTGHCVPSAVGGALLRYDLRNLRVQDYYCNINLGGNGAIYVMKLRKELGAAEIDRMLALKNKSVKADVIFYMRLIEEYKEILSKL